MRSRASTIARPPPSRPPTKLPSEFPVPEEHLEKLAAKREERKGLSAANLKIWQDLHGRAIIAPDAGYHPRSPLEADTPMPESVLKPAPDPRQVVDAVTQALEQEAATGSSNDDRPLPPRVFGPRRRHNPDLFEKLPSVAANGQPIIVGPVFVDPDHHTHVDRINGLIRPPEYKKGQKVRVHERVTFDLATKTGKGTLYMGQDELGNVYDLERTLLSPVMTDLTESRTVSSDRGDSVRSHSPIQPAETVAEESQEESVYHSTEEAPQCVEPPEGDQPPAYQEAEDDDFRRYMMTATPLPRPSRSRTGPFRPNSPAHRVAAVFGHQGRPRSSVEHPNTRSLTMPLPIQLPPTPDASPQKTRPVTQPPRPTQQLVRTYSTPPRPRSRFEPVNEGFTRKSVLAERAEAIYREAGAVTPSEVGSVQTLRRSRTPLVIPAPTPVIHGVTEIVSSPTSIVAVHVTSTPAPSQAKVRQSASFPERRQSVDDPDKTLVNPSPPVRRCFSDPNTSIKANGQQSIMLALSTPAEPDKSQAENEAREEKLKQRDARKAEKWASQNAERKLHDEYRKKKLSIERRAASSARNDSLFVEMGKLMLDEAVRIRSIDLARDSQEMFYQALAKRHHQHPRPPKSEEDGMLQYLYGRSLDVQGRHKAAEAVVAYDKALECLPPQGEEACYALKYIGHYMVQEEEYETAVTYFERLVRCDEKDSQSWAKLAVFYLNYGHLIGEDDIDEHGKPQVSLEEREWKARKQAIHAFKKVIRYDPENKSAREYLESVSKKHYEAAQEIVIRGDHILSPDILTPSPTSAEPPVLKIDSEEPAPEEPKKVSLVSPEVAVTSNTPPPPNEEEESSPSSGTIVASPEPEKPIEEIDKPPAVPERLHTPLQNKTPDLPGVIAPPTTPASDASYLHAALAKQAELESLREEKTSLLRELSELRETSARTESELRAEIASLKGLTRDELEEYIREMQGQVDKLNMAWGKMVGTLYAKIR